MAMNRATIGFLSLMTLSAGLPACGSDPGEDAVKTDQTLEVFNWWTNPGEFDALDAVLKAYAARYTQTHVINAAVPTNSKAQEELAARMVAGNPPDTFQNNAGWNLLKWVAYNGRDDADSKLEPVDFIVQQNKLTSVVPASVLDTVSYNGKVYGIPLDVHRYNRLFFNIKLFADNGLTPPTTLAEFYTVAEAFKAKGITALAIGSKDGHAVKTHTWDGLIVSKASVEFRKSYLTGHENPADQRIVDMLNEYAHMLDYSNADRDSLLWGDAAQRVFDGTAAMMIVGDFGRGFFLSKGWKVGVELGEIPLPGTSGNFIFVVDSFGLPKGVAHRQAAVNWLNHLATTEAQNVFNPLKGSTPPRTDVDRSVYSPIAQTTMDDFSKDTLAIATNLIVKNPEFVTGLNEAMRQFAHDRNVDAVINFLKNRYDQL
jgi:glucose/mannose transport system substrate-binding protein